ncbi:putative aldo-keto reductase [Xylariaceae sp. FL0255]|nr:putative aldo-keto reductase [Xylariaceae sp. FL0255]
MATPRLLYGTAWKKDATTSLVFKAIKAGFRGVDTAAQPRHYNEALVAAGIQQAISEGIVKREDLFIQTKFTPVGGQDINNLPYDPKAPLDEQVHASVSSSLKNFALGSPDDAYIDSLVLHSAPSEHFSDLVKVWNTLETYVPHKIKQLGISNTSLDVVRLLCTKPAITIRPSYVQNRFWHRTVYEGPLRAYCRKEGITFQCFWTLTGNPQLLTWAPVTILANAAAVSTEVALYALVLGLEGTSILDGTTNESHMAQDLKVSDILDVFAKSEDGQVTWARNLDHFKLMIHDAT